MATGEFFNNSIATSGISHLYYLKKEEVLTHSVCKYGCSEDGLRVKFAGIRYLLAEIMFLGRLLDSARKVLLQEIMLAIILVFCPITKP